MTEIQPKGFQTAALEKLAKFLDETRVFGDARTAFRAADGHGEYLPISVLPDTPTVCLRLPTGGGKTILASYTVGVAAEHYLDTDTPMVLWLVPSNAIRVQTLKALVNPGHPYRMVLDARFAGRVRVYDIADFALITPQDAGGNCCVIVATMQALRQTETERLQVYAHNENLEGHFATALARAATGLQPINETHPSPRFSFMNLLKMHRPLVLVDEAQNFATGLSAEIQRRIGPGVVVEFTATPPKGSNVLYRATAAELKADEMIKLPVVLTEHVGDWHDAVCQAVARRKKLTAIAAGEPGLQPVRPMLLIQAENKGKDADWRAIKEYLIGTEHLDEREIAVQTQDRHELDGVDLFAPGCPVTTVLTVQALREGWDCSFAYVLCSVANVGNEAAVEQWLGRVLRMPYAAKRKDDALNRAYAHVVSARFGETARQLQDALVGMGFEPGEAAGAVVSESGDLLGAEFRTPFTQVLPEAPQLDALHEAERARISVVPVEDGFRLTARGEMPEALVREVERILPERDRGDVLHRSAAHNRDWKPSPSERGELFKVPRLVVDAGDQKVLFDLEQVDLPLGFELMQYPADLSGFRFDETTRRYELDYEGRHVVTRPLGNEQMEFLPVAETLPELVGWLDRRLRRTEVTQTALTAWIRTALVRALDAGNLLDVLFRGKFLLLRKFAESFASAQMAWSGAGYQLLLDRAATETDDEFAFRFPREYRPNSLMSGGYRFDKHFYPRPGEMKGEGEEFLCAVEIDRLPEVEFWVRNLAGPGDERARGSFWLQTSRDRFYPDFVARLHDGRVLVVEYKGRKDETDVEDEELGRLWAERSGGKAVFLMARERDKMGRSVTEQLKAAVAGQQQSMFARK